MKFSIRRASSRNHNESPCEDAFQSSQDYTYIDSRTCKDAAEFDRLHGETEGPWLSEGANHRPDSRGIARDVTRTQEGWFVEINSLDDLMKFIEKEGEVIISNAYLPSITIYDSYIE